jgi:hypothetical protein
VTEVRKSDMVHDYAEFNDLDLLVLGKEFDKAIMGIAEHWTREGIRAEHVCYSKQGIVRVLMADMGELEAWEYAEFNIFCAYVGPGTPVYIDEFTNGLAHRLGDDTDEAIHGDVAGLLSVDKDAL